MKAMILAAGRGERMRPLTDDTPKPLLQVGGKMLIEYHLHNLSQAGISEVVINHAWLGEKISQALGDGSRYAVNIHYLHEQTALETAGGIINALTVFEDAHFIVVNGDIYCDFNFSSLPKEISAKAHLVMVDNPEHHPAGDFALQQQGGKYPLLKSDGENRKTFSGIGIYHPSLFAGLEKGVRPLAPVLRQAMDIDEVQGEYYDGTWFDIGTPERLHELDLQLRK